MREEARKKNRERGIQEIQEKKKLGESKNLLILKLSIILMVSFEMKGVQKNMNSDAIKLMVSEDVIMQYKNDKISCMKPGMFGVSVSVHFGVFSTFVYVEKVTEIRRFFHIMEGPVPPVYMNFSKILLRNHLKFFFLNFRVRIPSKSLNFSKKNSFFAPEFSNAKNFKAILEEIFFLKPDPGF